ncbi:MAG: protoporphyrinogen oxidase [Verrucomicrobiales bacterium]|jgi:protoporphyrinogen oxidase
MNHQVSQEKSWAVIGGGILGMTLALRLRQQGKAVTLYEAAEEIGGLASAWKIGDAVWDRYYHVTLMSDLQLRNILSDLQLEDDMEWVETRTGFYTDGKLLSMSNSIEFLKFPPLNLVEKVRLGATIFYASKLKNWKKLESIGVCEWLTKLSGKSVFEKIWKPLLRAKLGENYQHASAAFIWSIIARMYAARRSGLKKEMFGYLPGGYRRFLQAFEQRLLDAGVTIRKGIRVHHAERNGSCVKVDSSDGFERDFDHVVFTTPAPTISKACPALQTREHGLLNGIRYQGIVCPSLLLKKPLAGYYVTNITDKVPFTAIIDMTALIKSEEVNGHYLVYLPKYVDATDEAAFARSDEDLKQEFWPALKRIHPHLTDDDLVAFQVAKARNVLALSTLNYSESLPPVNTSIAGVHIVNSAMICNGTLNVNETIQLAENAAIDFEKIDDKIPAPAEQPQCAEVR